MWYLASVCKILRIKRRFNWSKHEIRSSYLLIYFTILLFYHLFCKHWVRTYVQSIFPVSHLFALYLSCKTALRSHLGGWNGLFMYSSANFSLARLHSLACFFGLQAKKKKRKTFLLFFRTDPKIHVREFMYLWQSLAMHNSVEWPVHLMESSGAAWRDTH